MALAAAPIPQNNCLIDLLRQKEPPQDRAIEIYRRLLSISELATSMSNARDLGQLEESLARTFSELAPGDSVRLCLADESSYRRVRLSGPDLGFEEGKFPLGEGLIGRVLQSGTPVRLQNGVPPSEPHSLYTGRSIMCLPFTGLGKVIGVLELVSDQEDRYDEFDYHLLLLLTAHLSSSIGNILTRQDLADANARLRDHDLRLTELNEQLRLLAQTDETTGLYNKRRLLEQLDAEIARAARYGEILGCLMIDIDDFKLVNDTYGHQAGDEALHQIGSLLKRSLRKTDFIARYGGEEFTVLLPRTNRAGALRVAQGICTRVRSSELITSRAALHLTVSIGIACCTKFDRLDAQHVILHADNALYRAKRTGKNRVCLSEENDTCLN